MCRLVQRAVSFENVKIILDRLCGIGKIFLAIQIWSNKSYGIGNLLKQSRSKETDYLGNGSPTGFCCR